MGDNKHFQKRLACGDSQAAQLLMQVTPTGTITHQNGHFTDTIQLHACEYFIRVNYNRKQALRMFCFVSRVNRAMHDLGMFPYHLQKVSILKKGKMIILSNSDWNFKLI